MIGTPMKSLKVIFTSTLLILGIIAAPGFSSSAQADTAGLRRIHTLAAASSATVFAETSYGAYGGYNVENGSYWYRDGYPYPEEKGFNQGGWGFSGSQSYGSYHPNNCHGNIDPNGLCFETGDVNGYHDQVRQIEWCPFGNRPEYCKNPNWANPLYDNYGYCTVSCGYNWGYNWFRYAGYIDKGWANGSRGFVKNGGTLGTSENPDAYRVFFTSDNPTYYPSGPQQNVPIVDVLKGGWKICWSGRYTENVAVSSIQSSCNGSFTIMAGSYEAFGQGVASNPSAGAATSIAMDGLTSCLVTAKGAVKCWGSVAGDKRRLNVPSGLRPSKSVALANGQVCALSIDGLVTCWGAEDSTDWAYKPWPTQMRPIKQLKGGEAMCALDVDDNLMCKGSWGNGLSIPIGQIRDFSVTWGAACATTLSNDLQCWGDTGPMWGRPASLQKAQAVSTALNWDLAWGRYSGNTCAIDLLGYLYCWGYDRWGATNVPADLGKVKSVSTSPFQTCAVTITNQLRCWGWIPGVGTPTVPADLGEVSSVTQGYEYISNSDFYVSTCVITITGSPRCWGRNPAVNDPPLLSPEIFDATGDPVITGSAAVGSELTASVGVWDSGTSFNYQWFKDGLAIEGAVNSTYSPTVLDFQHVISVNVTGSKVGFSPISKSTSIVTVGTGLLTLSSAPTISGTLTVGSTLTASAGAWDSSAVLTYQWLRDGVDIGNATSSSYLLTLDDYFHQISVAVTGRAYGYEATQISLAETVTAGIFSRTTGPELSGIAKVGLRLQASSGDWSPAGYVSYQWLRDGNQIEDATSDSYVVSSSDYQHSIAVQVTVGLAGFESRTETSASALVGPGVFANTPSLSVEGSASIASTLNAKVTNLSEGTSVAYQWLLDGQVIDGATGANYRVATTDFNHSISFRAVVAKSGYESMELTSPSTTPVKKIFFGLIAPEVKGQFAVGRNVSAAVTSMGSGVSYTYQWIRDGVAIEGAVTRKYVLTAADANTAVAFRVCVSKQQFETACLVSKPGVIALGDLSPKPVPVFKWTSVKVGAIMQGRPGNWGSGVALSYRWLRDGAEIAGENEITYRLSAADRGHSINFKVIAQKAGYNNVTRTSLSKFIP